MERIEIKTADGLVECNYAKNIFDLMDGLFRDMSRPLLMEIEFLLRPITISTKKREKYVLPELTILTFNKERRLVRRMDKLREGLRIPMTFDEKYVLEIPSNTNGLKNIETLEFRKIKDIKKQ